jgi:hypothetical protein
LANGKFDSFRKTTAFAYNMAYSPSPELRSRFLSSPTTLAKPAEACLRLSLAEWRLGLAAVASDP